MPNRDTELNFEHKENPPASSGLHQEVATAEVRSALSVEEKQAIHTKYLDERKSLIDTEQKYAESFDKIALTILSGGLALSVTFVKDLAPKPLSWTVWLLVLGWLVLVAGILASMMGLYWSQRSFEEEVRLCDAHYHDVLADREANGRTNPYSHRIHAANRFVILCIVLGVFLVFSFAGVNFVTKAQDANKPMTPQSNSPSDSSSAAPFSNGPHGRPVAHPVSVSAGETKGAPPSGRPLPAPSAPTQPSPAAPKPSSK